VNDLFNLDGKVAIVTGGNRGIGRAIANAVASAGANVIIAARDKEKMAEAVEEIRKSHGVKALAIETDVRQEGSINSMADKSAGAFGRIDILVNNAGIADGKRPLDLSLDEWNRVISTNLTSAFLCSKAVYPYMQAAGGGKIINIGSMASMFGSSVLPAYGASKGGIVQLTKSLAVAWAGDNIQVNAILPGWYRTEIGRSSDEELERHIASLTPMGRYGQPSELGGAAIFLASRAADFVTGISLPVDGGYSIALRGLDPPFPPPKKRAK
jgi:2-deoxy-D-gluconate 3-dehydrogenase